MSRGDQTHSYTLFSHFRPSSSPAPAGLRRFALRAFILVGVVCAAASSKDPLAVQASTPPVQTESLATQPTISRLATGEMSTEISVLTYNVKGLPWPLRLDLPDADPDVAMTKIGQHLAHLRAQGQAPDVVLIQEGFARTAGEIGRLGHYRYAAHGPTRDDADTATVTPGAHALAADADWTKGEVQGPVLDSGLHIFSTYPINVRARRAFGRYACAGYDCLAAKGVLVLTVDIPGAPDPVTILTLHMNANGASGVPEPRALAAHHLQIDSFADVLESDADPTLPLIFGGDFNVKAVRPRQDYADRRLGPARLTAVHSACALPSCDPRYPASNGNHWLGPRDIQGFRNGARVQVMPLFSAEMFASAEDGGQLSDHAGYLVRYRLTWGAP